MSCHIVLCHFVLCHIVLCHIVLCHICRVILYIKLLFDESMQSCRIVWLSVAFPVIGGDVMFRVVQ